jgi:hypothetical protein
MGCFLLLRDNFLSVDIISNSYASSEQAAFPAANVYNQQRRSKVWRSDGYWEIVSGDNTIVFQETIAVDLTATVAAGEYTSTTSFLAAVKTALEDVGASTYTVTQDATTKKIRIQSNGAGGGGILTLRWTHANSADMAAVMGFDTASDQTGALNYLADELRIHTSEWLKWDFGISTNPQAFVLIGARNEPIKITPSSVLKLQGNETDVWTSPSYETTLTYHDQAITKFSTSGLHTSALRYWRLSIVDRDNPLGYEQIGSAFLGNYYETTRGKPSFPLNFLPIDRSETVFSEGGQTFSDIREKSEGLSVQYRLLTKQEREELNSIFDKFGTAVPFFIALDNDETFSTDANVMVRYVKFAEPIKFTLETPNNFSADVSLREEL